MEPMIVLINANTDAVCCTLNNPISNIIMSMSVPN